MYFTQWHIFTVFASIVIYIFAQYLIFYFVKDKKKFYIFSFALFTFLSIFSYSTLMTIDDMLKKVEVKNIQTFQSGNSVIIRGMIYNVGKAPVKTCIATIRISNTKAKKVDGSIFDTSRRIDPYAIKKFKNSYYHELKILGVINERGYKNFTLTIPYPKHFAGYKVFPNIKCK